MLTEKEAKAKGIRIRRKWRDAQPDEYILTTDDGA